MNFRPNRSLWAQTQNDIAGWIFCHKRIGASLKAGSTDKAGAQRLQGPDFTASPASDLALIPNRSLTGMSRTTSLPAIKASGVSCRAEASLFPCGKFLIFNRFHRWRSLTFRPKTK
jgi:hypothetical protein